MIGGNFDEDDADAVGVLDPHFGQSPGFRCGPSEDTSSCRSQPVVLCVNIANLEPDHHRAPGRAGRVAGDLEQSRAEEEHQPWICGRAELPVDRQAQYVAIETMAAAQVGGAQQDPTAQNLHAPILAAPVAADSHIAARRHVGARPSSRIRPTAGAIPLASSGSMAAASGARCVPPGQRRTEPDMTAPPGACAHEGVPLPVRRSPHGERRNMAPAGRYSMKAEIRARGTLTHRQG
jgi:hypothetical protein